MRLATTIRLAVSIVLVALAAPRLTLGQVVGGGTFFTPSPDLAAGLDPAGIYPQGRKIGFGAYSVYWFNLARPPLDDMKMISQGGFTLAGPYVGLQDPVNIDHAIANNLKFTYEVHIAGYDAPDNVPAVLDEAYIRSQVRKRVEEVIANPARDAAVARWSICPEELRYWNANEMRFLQIVTDTIRQVELEHHDKARPIWMYEPNHRRDFELVQSGQYQDIVSRGVYVNRVSLSAGRNAQAVWGFQQIVSAAGQLGTVPQAVLELNADLPDPQYQTADAIRRLLRHDVYLGLVKGIRSVNIWTLAYRPFPTLTRQDQFNAYASVATDLTGPLDLQEVFLFGQPRGDLSVEQLSGPLTLTPWTDPYGETHTYQPVSFLNTAYGTSRYLFLVNSAEDGVEVSVAGLPVGVPLVVLDLLGGPQPDIVGGSFRLSLEPLGVRALQVSSAIPGDINCDGLVDTVDFKILKQNFARTGGWSDGNVNGDSIIDTQDFRVLKMHFGQSVYAGASAPEPAGMSLLALGGSCLLVKARRAPKRRRPARRRKAQAE